MGIGSHPIELLGGDRDPKVRLDVDPLVNLLSGLFKIFITVAKLKR